MHVLWLLLAGLIVVATAAEDNDVFNAENCGLNGYEISSKRPAISRLKEFPWLARMGFRRNNTTEFHFHGTLIHPYYVLTTVLAVEYYPNSLEMVRLGDYQRSTSEDCQEINDEERCAPSPQDIPIEYVIKHPDHNKPRMANDLVLVKLQRPAAIDSNYVRPICIPAENFELADTVSLFLSAWCGSIKTGISDIPLQYRMKKIGPTQCTEKLSRHIRLEVQESQFCATLDLDSKKQPTKEISLRGSTGSPLQMQGPSGQFYLLGMSSVGVKRATVDTPYVFTNVPKLAEWLRETVAREEEKRSRG